MHYTSSAPHHTLSFQKGEKQQQLSGKGTVILPKKNSNKISKDRGLRVKIVIVTVAFLSRNETEVMKDLFRLGNIKAGRPTVLLPKTSLFLFPLKTL